ncbi:MAG: hypothetical protein RIC95_08865 [Vicingaceae bacterium]
MSKNVFFVLFLFGLISHPSRSQTNDSNKQERVSQLAELNGKVSAFYDESDSLHLTNSDRSVHLNSYRLINSGRLDSLVTIINGNQVAYRLERNKYLLNSKSDTVIERSSGIFTSTSELYFPKENKIVKSINYQPQKGSKYGGWAYLSEGDTLAILTYRYFKKEEHYAIKAKYNPAESEALPSLLMGLARFDKRVQMDYETNDTFEIIAAVLLSGIFSQ